MRITQAFTFEAAHRLPNVPPDHKCYRMHGHSYRVEVTLEGPVDPVTGFVADFLMIEGVVGQLIAELDHNTLNDVQGLENPTAENIATWIGERVSVTALPLASVRVFETPYCWAEYSPAHDNGETNHDR